MKLSLTIILAGVALASLFPSFVEGAFGISAFAVTGALAVFGVSALWFRSLRLNAPQAMTPTERSMLRRP